MRKMKLCAALAMASVTALVLAGCGGSKPAATTAAAAAESTAAATTEAATEAATTAASTASGDFNFALNIASEPQSIDPALNSAVDGGIMLNHMFEGLAKWVDDGEGNAKIVPGQAEKWDKVVNADGTVTYTFHMRDGIKWSDGKPVTAQDFEYSWKRLANPATAADYNYMVDMVKGYDDIVDENKKADPDTLAVKALDDKTLEVVLTYDCPYFDNILAFPATYPVRKDIVEGNTEWTYKPETYISNGPYKMTEWVHNASITMAQNENYYDVAKLGPKTITFKLMDDQNAALAGYKSGELNFVEQIPQDEIANYLASGELKVKDYLGTYYVCFNVQDPAFQDARVRKAFSLVIDRNYIVEQVTQAGQVPATGYVPSGVADQAGSSGDDFRTVGGNYYSVDPADYQKNCEEARKLLAEAGYPEGKGFPTVEYLYNTNDGHKKIGEALQAMWQKELGVTVTLSNQDWNVFLQNRKQGKFQIARNGWIGDYNYPSTFLDMWITGGGNNDAQYSNPAYDEQIKIAKSTADPAVAMPAFHKAEDILMKEDNVLAPIYFYTQTYMMSDNIEGMYYTPLGFFFFGYTHQK